MYRNQHKSKKVLKTANFFFFFNLNDKKLVLEKYGYERWVTKIFQGVRVWHLIGSWNCSLNGAWQQRDWREVAGWGMILLETMGTSGAKHELLPMD